MSFIRYFSSARQVTFVMLLVVLLVVTACNPTASNTTESRTFVIGEINNIPTGNYLPAEGQPITTRQGNLHAALAKMGYVEGKDIIFKYDVMVPAPPPVTPVPTGSAPVTPTTAPDATPAPPPPGDLNRLDAVAKQMVEDKVDLIISYGTSASRAAARATAGTSIPVVFVGAMDPVQLGLVKSLQNTEGNVTGIGGTSDSYGKQLEWLLRIDPSIKTVLSPYATLEDPVGAQAMEALKTFAEKAGVELITIAATNADDPIKILEDNPDIDAIVLNPLAPITFIQAAITKKIPLANAFPNIMNLGPFMSFNLTEQSVGEGAARYVDRILRGAKPSDLPVELVTSTLALNLQTATAIGVTVPEDILQQATIIVR